jgi:hypothetical protein
MSWSLPHEVEAPLCSRLANKLFTRSCREQICRLEKTPQPLEGYPSEGLGSTRAADAARTDVLVVTKLVDLPECIDALTVVLRTMMPGGLATVEPVTILSAPGPP